MPTNLNRTAAAISKGLQMNMCPYPKQYEKKIVKIYFEDTNEQDAKSKSLSTWNSYTILICHSTYYTIANLNKDFLIFIDE